MPSSWANAWGQSWGNSWGSITFVVVVPVSPSGGGGDGAYPGGLACYPPYWCGRKRKRKKRTLPLRSGRDYQHSVMTEDISVYYDEILKSPVPEAVKLEAMAVIDPYAETHVIPEIPVNLKTILSDTVVDSPDPADPRDINWDAVKRKPDVMSEILEIWLDEVEQIRLDDEEVIMVLYS